MTFRLLCLPTLTLLALFAFANSASADTNLLGSDNYSFEDPAITSSTPYIITTSIQDWSFSQAGGYEATGVQTISSAFDNTGTSDGLNYALLNIQQNGPGIITYTGTGADALPVILPDTDYTLTVAVGNRTQDYSSAVGGTDTVDLLAGTNTFGTTVNEANPLLIPDSFTDETVTLTAATILADNLVGQSLGIQLLGSQYGSDGFDQAAFDNVRLTATTVAAPVLVTLYYDTNGMTPGTATTSSTPDFKGAVWTQDSGGSTATSVYLPSSDVVFSANDGVNVGSGTQTVTVTDLELVHSFTFNNGTVTLNGSGGPSLHIEAGGIAVNSNDGPTTFDSTLGTISLDASQSWNNNSAQALNVNSGVTGSGQTLSFNGDSTGPVNLNGILSGNLNLNATSTTSTINVENIGPNPPGPLGTYVGTLNASPNSFTGTITINGGVVNFANISSLGNGGNNIDLSNGGTVSFDSTEGFAAYGNNINLTGTGQISSGVYGAGGVDIVYSGTITGGPTSVLNVVEGDFIPVSNDPANDIGTINVTGGSRLLAYGAGIFSNNAVVNVKSSSILDFGIGGNSMNPLVLGNNINLASGSALENRGGGISLTDVVLPTGTATVTVGSDDDPTNGSITLNGPAINLAYGTTLTIVSNAIEHYTEYTAMDEPPPAAPPAGYSSDPINDPFNNTYNSSSVSQTAVHLGEQITGSGNLVITPEEAPVINYEAHPTKPNGDVVGYRLGYGSPIYLDGANNYSGTTTIDGATVYVGASGFGTSAVFLNGGSGGNYFDNVSQIELSGGDFSNSVTVGTPETVGNSLNVINLVGGSPDETISGPINLTVPGGTLLVYDSSNSNLSVGNIHFDATTGPDHYVNFENEGSGVINLTGTYASDYVNPQAGNAASVLNFGAGGENGTYTLTSTSDFTGMENNGVNGEGALELWAGTLNIETSKFNDQTIDVQYNPGTNHTVNLVGGQTIDTYFYVNIGDGPWTLAQTTADYSTSAGGIGNYASTFDVSAVAGGRLNQSGDVGGYLFNGVIKTGAGTVVFSNNSPSLSGNDFQTPNGVIADIQQGTLLVNNVATKGYGLGQSNGIVKIEAGATFGGTTTLYGGQQVVAEDPTAIIAPGDAGQANLGIKAKIGTLTLPGIPSGTPGQAQSDGLVAADGLTMDFKLGSTLATPRLHPGVDNDFISLGGMELTGTVTINLSALGNPLLGLANYYILFQGTGDTRWTGAPPTFVINTPTGYYLNPAFGTSDGLGDGKRLGYIYNPVANYFYVDLIPEPSTYGLLGLGLLALVAIGRFRRLDDNRIISRKKLLGCHPKRQAGPGGCRSQN
jgi:autotransporter-associated beta strand protein